MKLATVIVPILLPRLSDLALDGTPAMSEAVFVNGPKRLPIRFKMD